MRGERISHLLLKEFQREPVVIVQGDVVLAVLQELNSDAVSGEIPFSASLV
jgi:hypothetical protein